MSEKNINYHFRKFGKKMVSIAILTLISFIATIIGMFTLIGGIINFIMTIFILFFFLSALANIKEAGKILNNNNLFKYRTKLIWGTILRVIGGGLISVGFMGVIVVNSRVLLIIFISLIVLGAIIWLIGSIFRIQSWSRLQSFFKANMSLFPPNLAKGAHKGAKLSKFGSILDITIFLEFIGNIFRIIGYFKLSKLKNLQETPSFESTQKPVKAEPIEEPTEEFPKEIPKGPPKEQVMMFCPNCGSKLRGGEKFCSICGSEV